MSSRSIIIELNRFIFTFIHLTMYIQSFSRVFDGWLLFGLVTLNVINLLTKENISCEDNFSVIFLYWMPNRSHQRNWIYQSFSSSLHVTNVASFLETLLRMFLEPIDCVFVLQFSPRLSLYNWELAAPRSFNRTSLQILGSSSVQPGTPTSWHLEQIKRYKQ